MNKEILDKLKDPKYYLEHFAKIKGKTPGLIPFILNEAQKDLFNTLNEHSRVIILKARQLGFCLSEHTKILTSNLEWVELKDIQIGDSIIAVDENNPGDRKQRKMRTAIVENKFSFETNVLKIKLSDGRVLIATPEHRMLSKKWEAGTETIWKEVGKMKIGDSIRYITKTWDNGSFEDGWFGGMIDGEGSLSKPSRTGVSLNVAQVAGDVLERLKQYVISRGIIFRMETDNRKSGTSSKLGDKPVYKIVINRMDEVFRVLGVSRPSRLLPRKWWEGKALPNDGWVKIVSIEDGGVQRVVDLQTSEHTYIAEGLVSHNSTSVTGYFYHKTIMTPGTNTALIGYNSDLTAELLDKVKTFMATCPPELRPTVQYNSKYELSFPKINSKILVLPSTENVGRGYTLHNALCVSGNTDVFSENGRVVKIKDVSIGDNIVNGNGGKSKVVAIRKKKPDKDMVSLDVIGNIENLRLTKDHLVLTRKGWMEAGMIKKGDFVGYPYFQLRNRFTEVDLSTYVKEKYRSRTKAGVIELSRDFGEVCGWFASEGSVTEGRTIFSVNKKEVEYLSNLLSETIGHSVNKISVYYSKKSETATISVYSQPFASFLEEHFGNGAKNKTLSDKIWYWGWEFGYGLLKGLFLGDGCLTNNRSAIFVSISSSLVYQIKKLLVSLRIGLASINSAETNRYGTKNQTRYNLSLSGPGNYKLRRKLGFELPTYDNGRFRWILENDPGRNYGWKSWFRGRFHYWMKVRSVSEIEREDYVYDISLDGEPHSFLTHSGVVHNCTELSSWEKADEKMMTLEASVPLNGLIVIESTPRGQGNLYHRMWMSDNDYIKKEYGWWWLYTEEEIEIIKRRMNDPRKFAQEYELTFLASGRMVFDPDVIDRMRDNQLKVGEIVKLENGQNHVVKEERGVIMYKPPEEGHTYVVGVDVAEGVTGGDYSVAVVFDRKTGEEVAFYRGHIAPDKFSEKLNDLGRLYNNALMVVEINNHGLTTVTVLKQLMYPSMYFRPAKFEVMGSPYSDKLGWKTTKMTRPLLIDDLAQALRDGDLLIHSKEIIDEMTVFVYDDKNDSGAQQGFHDDCVMSVGIGFQGFKIMSDKPLVQLSESKVPIFGGY